MIAYTVHVKPRKGGKKAEYDVTGLDRNEAELLVGKLGHPVGAVVMDVAEQTGYVERLGNACKFSVTKEAG